MRNKRQYKLIIFVLFLLIPLTVLLAQYTIDKSVVASGGPNNLSGGSNYSMHANVVSQTVSKYVTGTSWDIYQGFLHPCNWTQIVFRAVARNNDTAYVDNYPWTRGTGPGIIFRYYYQGIQWVDTIYSEAGETVLVDLETEYTYDTLGLYTGSESGVTRWKYTEDDNDGVIDQDDTMVIADYYKQYNDSIHINYEPFRAACTDAGNVVMISFRQFDSSMVSSSGTILADSVCPDGYDWVEWVDAGSKLAFPETTTNEWYTIDLVTWDPHDKPISDAEITYQEPIIAELAASFVLWRTYMLIGIPLIPREDTTKYKNHCGIAGGGIPNGDQDLILYDDMDSKCDFPPDDSTCGMYEKWWRVLRYYPNIRGYKRYLGYDDPLSCEPFYPGRGFWIGQDHCDSIMVDVRGLLVDTTKHFEIPLFPIDTTATGDTLEASMYSLCANPFYDPDSADTIDVKWDETLDSIVRYTWSVGRDFSEWYGAGDWAYRKRIIIDHTQVDDTLLDFAVLLSTVDTDVGAKAKADGSDIVITKGDGVTKLHRDLDKFRNDTLALWFRADTLLSEKDDTFYIYYGNAAASESDNDSTWAESYAAVWHLDEEGGNWYDADWAYRKAVVIDHTQVSDTLIDFPILISTVDTDIGTDAKADGSDIVITKGDGLTKLHRDIEKFRNDTLIIWFRADSLLSETDDTFYVYYGNPTASESDNDSTWDDNFAAVWHLGEGGTGTRSDGTSNSNDGTPTNYDGDEAALGKIGLADDLDGANDFINVADNATLDITSQITMEMWLYTRSLTHVGGGNYPTPVAKSTGNYRWFINSGNKSYTTRFSGLSDLTSSDTVRINTWTHVVMTYHQSNGFKWYIDGSLDNSDAQTGAMTANANNLTIGNWDDGTSGDRWYQGIVDEVRISDVSRSADWISTEYNNQNSPATFVTLGTAEDTSGNLGTRYDATSNNNDGAPDNYEDDEGVVGKIVGSDSLDGTNDYLDCGADASLNFERTDSFSIAGWVKFQEIGSSTNEVILAKRSDAGNNPGYIFWKSTGDELNFQLENAPTDRLWMQTSGATLSNDTWYYIACAYDGSSDSAGVMVYIDGVEQNLSTQSNNLISSIQHADAFRIGRQHDSNPLDFNGTLDELQISNVYRDSAWISTSYGNQGTPSTFLSLSAEEDTSSVAGGDTGWALDGIYSVGDAVDSVWIGAHAQAYRGVVGGAASYIALDAAIGERMYEWEGFWVTVYTTDSLVLLLNNAGGSFKKDVPSDKRWVGNIGVTVPELNLIDAWNKFGLAEEATSGYDRTLDVPELPEYCYAPGAQNVILSFISDDRRKTLAHDFQDKYSKDNQWAWKVLVDTRDIGAGQLCELYWNVSGIPENIQLNLIDSIRQGQDIVQDIVIDMRKIETYKFVSDKGYKIFTIGARRTEESIDEEQHTFVDEHRDFDKPPTELEVITPEPNPFSEKTRLTYGVPKEGSRINITIFDINGNYITGLYNGLRGSGWHTSVWDGTDKDGKRVSNGVYLWEIKAENKVLRTKVILFR